MPKLTDIQLVILSAAEQRDDSAILPLPDSLNLNKGTAASVLKRLIKKGLIEERSAGVDSEVWRVDDDGDRLALARSETGLDAIGVEPNDETGIPEPKAKTKPKRSREPRTKPSADNTVRPGTKQALLINLLKRKKGATIDEAVEATGWQAHTVRGAISGALKKKLGLTVTSEKVKRCGRVYRITGQG